MNYKFIAKTAFLDGRKNVGKLAVFMTSIVLGIGALVAINSFHYGLEKDIDLQAASLLGADLAITGNAPATEDLATLWNNIPGEKSSQIELLSMALLPIQDVTQFVRIKALEGDFPYYGNIVSTPTSAAVQFKNKKGVLLENSLMLQYELSIGDSLQLGDVLFPIIGSIENSFGGNGFSSTVAPSVYMAQKFLAETNLVQPGSLIDYSYFFKTSENFELTSWVEENKPTFRAQSFRIDTIESRKVALSEAFDMLNNFLNLIALVSLLLGCIGVASSVYVYVKSKVESIAILRCIGMKGSESFLVYWFQIFVIGFIAVVLGVILGSLLQIMLPMVLSDFLPFEVSLKISWKAILEGIVMGSLFTGLFALLPLLTIRNISPLRAIRSVIQPIQAYDRYYVGVIAFIALSVIAFLSYLTKSFSSGVLYSLGIMAAFLLLYGVSFVLIRLIKKYAPRNIPFIYKQGLSNLFRPNNQTQTLLISIGLGTAVLTTLFIVQSLLLSNVASMDAGNQPNMILYGIESNQVQPLQEEFASFDLPVIQNVPIVTMKLEGWKGKTKATWLADSTRTAKDWVVHRETRVTYRDTLDTSEALVKGSFSGTRLPDEPIYISLGESYAEDLGVDIGDEMIFNVQGMQLTTYVSSIRSIDFTKMQTRFFVVFPTGVLEQAPQFSVFVTKTPNDEVTASFRSAVVRQFPNVSVIDVAMVLKTVNDILNKVSYVIQFMAFFSIFTGIIVLLSSLLLSKYQRIKESVLLRTLGASSAQIQKINGIEYFIIGSFSAITGICIAVLVSYIVVKFQFQLDFIIHWWSIFIIYICVVTLVMVIGIMNSRSVVRKSPLAVLRTEIG